MKKILISLIILISGGFLMAQGDSIQLSTVDVKQSTDATDGYFPYFELKADTTMYRVSALYVMPWRYTSGYLYPRSSSYKLLLGGAEESGGYHTLKVAGTSYFEGSLTAAYRIYIGGSKYIYSSGNNMMFYDPVAGANSLWDLATQDTILIETEMLTLKPKASKTPTLGGYYFDSDDSTYYVSTDGSTWTNLITAIDYPDNDTLEFTDGSYITSNTNNIKLHPDGQTEYAGFSNYLDKVKLTIDKVWFQPNDTNNESSVGQMVYQTSDNTFYGRTAHGFVAMGSGNGTIGGTIAPGQIAYGTAADEIGGFNRILIIDTTLRLELITPDTGIYISNSHASGIGELITNAEAGQGLRLINSSTGQGLYGVNSSTGYLIDLFNNSSGVAIQLNNNSTGNGMVIDATSTGNALVTKDDGTIAFTIDSAGSVFLNAYDAVTTYAWMYFDSATHKIELDSSEPASEALVTFIPDLYSFKDWFYDRRNGEIQWFNSITKEWTFNFMRQRPATKINMLQGGIEIAYRYIDMLIDKNKELETRLKVIEDRLNRLEK